jgi:alpha-mannosidase
VLSTAKPAEGGNGTAVREYNIGDDAVQASVALNEPHGKVRSVDLNEEHPRVVKGKDGRVQLNLRANQIATLRYEA